MDNFVNWLNSTSQTLSIENKKGRYFFVKTHWLHTYIDVIYVGKPFGPLAGNLSIMCIYNEATMRMLVCDTYYPENARRMLGIPKLSDFTTLEDDGSVEVEYLSKLQKQATGRVFTALEHYAEDHQEELQKHYDNKLKTQKLDEAIEVAGWKFAEEAYQKDIEITLKGLIESHIPSSTLQIEYEVREHDMPLYWLDPDAIVQERLNNILSKTTGDVFGLRELNIIQTGEDQLSIECLICKRAQEIMDEAVESREN